MRKSAPTSMHFFYVSRPGAVPVFGCAHHISNLFLNTEARAAESISKHSSTCRWSTESSKLIRKIYFKNSFNDIFSNCNDDYTLLIPLLNVNLIRAVTIQTLFKSIHSKNVWVEVECISCSRARERACSQTSAHKQMTYPSARGVSAKASDHFND